MNYTEELTKAMTWLGQQPDTIFLGQNVIYGGNAMHQTLQGVPNHKIIELPVAEEMQLGMSIGLTLTGKCVISIYPRFDFLLLAVNQLVNHLDKLEEFTNKEYETHVIIRVGIGATSPMNPGVQHSGDYTEAFRKLLKMPVVKLDMPELIMPVYLNAYTRGKSTLIIEDMNLYA